MAEQGGARRGPAGQGTDHNNEGQSMEHVTLQRLARATYDIPVGVVTRGIDGWYPASEFKRALMFATRFVEDVMACDLKETTTISGFDREGPIHMTTGTITTLQLHTVANRWDADTLRALVNIAGQVGVRQQPRIGKPARFKVVYA